MKLIGGGVVAPLGFKSAGIHCGIRKNKDKLDLALIHSDQECSAAAVYTTNKVKAAPIYLTMQHLENGTARAMLCNSGNANACAPAGNENAKAMCESVANALNISAEDVIVASTGVIGVRLDTDPISQNAAKLVDALTADECDDVTQAIMTTDTIPKFVAVEFELGGKTVKIGGIAKGSGMIHPNMATMLAFLTTDAAISPQMLQLALSQTTKRTYNMVSVDGDTSTNDMAAIMASGLAQNEVIDWENEDFTQFVTALEFVNRHLAMLIARDGEGASKLITCNVLNCRTQENAAQLARQVISSSLVKAAMFGSDANWGRVLCALGYARAPFRPEYVDVSFSSAAGQIMVCQNGAGLDFDEDIAKKVLTQDQVCISVDLKEGTAQATAWGCDLTYDYVKINGDYRT